MLTEKQKIKIYRILSPFLIILGILGLIFSIDILTPLYDIDNEILVEMLIIIYVAITFSMLFLGVGFLSIKYRRYDYNGIDIMVYSGAYHHYIKVDGEIVDEHNTLVSYRAIELSSILADGTPISARISLSGAISLKINGTLYNNRVK